MSKIVIKSNDSGTGTFTIESPNSNTNRTLSLPDESGSVLSDSSTIDSNNLQSDVYKQDNIVGTVSQSSGVPTGAIIQRGSNANGEFVRYADGTQICTGSKTVNVAENSERTIISGVTYAVSFISAPSASAGLGSNYGNQFGFAGTSAINANNFTLILLRSGPNNTSGNTIGLFSAIGRWF